jgi:hypothetical protein
MYETQIFGHLLRLLMLQVLHTVTTVFQIVVTFIDITMDIQHDYYLV